METKPAPLQIFKPGRHTAMNGAVLDFSESQLQAAAAAYDPAKHEAPLVVGHPRLDAPAYGWVKSLAFAAGALEAAPDQVDAGFAEMVAAGRFKKISASFFTPESPQNPVPGVYYLRHVGFLGAQPPAVKGLRTPSFAESEEGVVEFGDWSDIRNASLWRRLRDFIIAQFGLEKADSVIPDYAVADLEDEARRETPDEPAPAPAFSAPPLTQETVVTPEQKAALEAENAQLKARVAEQEAQAKAARLAARHAEHASFADGLVTAGKLLPAHQAFVVAFMDSVAEQGGVIEFGEGDAKQSKPGVDAFKSFLAAQPKQVEFAEIAKREAEGGAVNFAAPAGYSVDPERLELHQKAMNYAAANKCGYEEALAAVTR